MKMVHQRKGLLLLASCVLFACLIAGINHDVPDGVVYTDLHKTARKGDDLTLKCQFYGSPFAVYWKKGEDPFNSPDLIKWMEGESPSGSCVRDQSCSMDDDYSLIIKDISIANQGRYICLVSNYLGILIHNFTEVTVYGERDNVYTDLFRTAHLGENVLLPCRFHRESPTVLWINGSTSRNSPVMIKRKKDGMESGSCLSDKRCYMNDDYSLIIKNIQISDQGQYLCLVTNNRGKYIQSTTNLTIYAAPTEPYPTIHGCGNLPVRDKSEGICTIPTSDQVTLTCSASRYYPTLVLSFLHGDENITSLGTTVQVQNEDGTKSKYISIQAKPSEKVFICVASGIPNSSINSSVTVLVNRPYPPTRSDTSKIEPALAVLGFFVSAMILVVLVSFIWMKYRRNSGNIRTK